MSWTSVRVEPGADGGEAGRASVLSALFEAGAQGVEERDGALLTHFPEGTDLDAIARAIGAADPDARIATTTVPDTDWSEAWKARLAAHTLGTLTVAPPWLAAGLDPATTIVIDPGMAFGTGDHPTTRGIIRLLPRFLTPGSRVADLGTGSAVLAIAAARLGAGAVAAIEIDADAIGNAEENVARNGVGSVVRVLHGDAALLLPLLAPVDLVVANILSSVIIELLPVIGAGVAERGAIILSGILSEEAAAMREHLASAGWVIAAEDQEDVWWTVAATRP